MGDPYSDASQKQIQDMVDAINKELKAIDEHDNNPGSSNAPGWGSFDCGTRIVDACDAADNKANAHLWHDDASSHTSTFEPLKVQCFFCQSELSAMHLYDFSPNGGKYEIHIRCSKCDKNELIRLTQLQINEINRQGCWQAFLK